MFRINQINNSLSPKDITLKCYLGGNTYNIQPTQYYQSAQLTFNQSNLGDAGAHDTIYFQYISDVGVSEVMVVYRSQKWLVQKGAGDIVLNIQMNADETII